MDGGADGRCEYERESCPWGMIYADGHRTNVLEVPLAMMARPEDHAGIYVLLASRANSRATTGAIIPSDCGMKVRGGDKRETERG